uniref:Uncharacterized protein n=1 Tax=Anguilla anguilla TaxID=7936 RepID=A0A0E9PW53_ANGAN
MCECKDYLKSMLRSIFPKFDLSKELYRGGPIQ